MDIAQYISDLLNEHNEVSLPGIGTFFKRNVNAHYNADEGLYYPPSRKIDYKAEEGSDSTLVQHIVNSKHISESSAMYFVERFCDNLRKNLDQGSKVTISPLGTLFKKQSGYALEQSELQSSLEHFGLKPVKEFQFSGEHSTGTAASPATDLSEPKAESAPSGSKGVFIVLGILLVLGILTGLAYYFYPQYFKNLTLPGSKAPSKKTAPLPLPQTDSLEESEALADTILKNLEREGLHGAEVEKAPDTLNISTTASAADTLKTPALPPKTYEVIVASFGLKKEAENSIKNLRKAGIDAKVVVDTKKPKYKVSIGGFPTMQAANKEKLRIQKGVNKDAWILTVTNK